MKPSYPTVVKSATTQYYLIITDFINKRLKKKGNLEQLINVHFSKWAFIIKSYESIDKDNEPQNHDRDVSLETNFICVQRKSE